MKCFEVLLHTSSKTLLSFRVKEHCNCSLVNGLIEKQADDITYIPISLPTVFINPLLILPGVNHFKKQEMLSSLCLLCDLCLIKLVGANIFQI